MMLFRCQAGVGIQGSHGFPGSQAAVAGGGQEEMSSKNFLREVSCIESLLSPMNALCHPTVCVPQ